jgi:hypothetical protein
MTIQVLTFIALWCGQPINATKGAMGFKSGADVSSYEIKTCRTEMTKCLKENAAFIQVPEHCLNKSPY